jgi:hypothetical protein
MIGCIAILWKRIKAMKRKLMLMLTAISVIRSNVYKEQAEIHNSEGRMTA